MFYYRFKEKNKKIKFRKNFTKGSWIDGEKLSDEEILKLSKKHKIEVGLLEDSRDIFEAPRLEVEGGQAYFFARFPAPKNTENLSTLPFLIVLSSDFVLTSYSLNHTPYFIKLLRESRDKDFSTKDGVLFLIEAFRLINQKYHNGFRNIRKEVYQNKINLSKIDDRTIERFVELETVVNDFISALIPMSLALEKIFSIRDSSD